ncbi:hypothetical protein P3102_22535 [Amycolatopsis sp. QT-25]|uniref:hypothetical protein n=1 Tax=Amycolatopsis sp. QT-25 TaxID=3034022 RepID=UPI0023EC10FD|nr:hypothetical protein [Amycolatopsis sp. QT-25]WET76884.1 hypothetical protein P3102_22535 [Amycolatopsis sp. QT-25]
MRVLLLRSLGGHPARTIVDQDQAAAEWLLTTGMAVAAPDTAAEPAESSTTEPIGPAETETAAPAEPVTSTAASRGRRSSRTATPGG